MTNFAPGSYEAIAWEWFPLIADRLRHPLDAATVDAYVRAFRAAQLTPRGLVAACDELFVGTKFWPAPGEFIRAAKAAEVRALVAERPIPVAVDESSRDSDERLRLAKAFAAPWVAEHADEYAGIVARTNAEWCARYRLADIRDMTAVQKEFRDATIVRLCARAAYDDARAKTPTTAHSLPITMPWPEKLARARSKVREMFAKGQPTPAASSSVSAGSHVEPGAVS